MEKAFVQKQLLFEIDTTISVAEIACDRNTRLSIAPNKNISVIDFDFIGIKKIYFQKTTSNELIVSKTELW